MEALEHRVKMLEERCGFLMEMLNGQNEITGTQTKGAIDGCIQERVLRSLVEELAEQHGVESERFDAVYEALLGYHRDVYFRQLEDAAAGSAARLDDREIGEMPENAECPRLFD